MMIPHRKMKMVFRMSLSRCKSADGEFICRGMDDDKLLKVLKAMESLKMVFDVMKNDDGVYWCTSRGNVINDEGL